MPVNHFSIVDASLTPSLRDALITEEPRWFQHYGAFDRIDDIRKCGLLPCTKEADTFYRHVAKYAAKAAGLRENEVPKILCLSPHPRRAWLQLHGTRALFAVAAADLPERLGLDWSFSDPMGTLDRIVDANPSYTVAEAFAAAVEESMTLISYEKISPAVLRVRLKSSESDDPKTWPFLKEVTDDDVVARFYEPDPILGY